MKSGKKASSQIQFEHFFFSRNVASGKKQGVCLLNAKLPVQHMTCSSDLDLNRQGGGAKNNNLKHDLSQYSGEKKNYYHLRYTAI